MTHSDDEGLVLPPKLAPIQVVIVPIPTPQPEINDVAEKIMRELRDLNITVKYDTDDTKRAGFKFAEYELRGMPVRIAIGKRDIENNVAEVARRDTREKTTISLDGIGNSIKQLLDDIQQNLYNRAKHYRDEHITRVDSFDEFIDVLEHKTGFISAHWDGTAETEETIKEKTKATIRCIPLNNPQEDGVCVLTGKPSKQRVLFAKAY
jgi:prolyl-tRNA synthetase